MKKKQHHKSKEELLVDLKKNKEFQDNMKFTREVFYPALCKGTKNVDDALYFLSSFTTVMMEVFLGLMKDKKLGELNLISKLDPQDTKHEELKALISLFEDMSIFEAKAHFENMKGEIQLFCNEEMKVKKLEDLKTTWIDEYIAKV